MPTSRRPGAQARKAGRFTGLHDEFWTRARRDRGDAARTRALIDVLWLHRRLPAGAVAAGLRAALLRGLDRPRGRGDRGAPLGRRYDQLLSGAGAADASGGQVAP